MCPQNSSHINITSVSSQQPMLPHALSLYIRTSIASHTTNGSSNPTRVSPESSSSLTSSPSVSLSSSGPLHLLNSLSGPSLFLPFGVLSPFSSLYLSHRCVGVIGGVFVCASWGLRATDRMISVVGGPDDTDSIAPPDSARSGGLRSKWTGGTLRARPSTASLRPGGWIAEGGGGGAGSPYAGSTYSGVSSYASSPAGSPMPPYSPYSPASAPPPLSGRRSPGTFPGTPAGLGLSPGFFPPTSAPAAGALRTPATAATLGSPAPGIGTPAFGHFPPTPRSPLSGLAVPLPPRDTVKKDD
jgi:hypothetical protein